MPKDWSWAGEKRASIVADEEDVQILLARVAESPPQERRVVSLALTHRRVLDPILTNDAPMREAFMNACGNGEWEEAERLLRLCLTKVGVRVAEG